MLEEELDEDEDVDVVVELDVDVDVELDVVVCWPLSESPDLSLPVVVAVLPPPTKSSDPQPKQPIPPSNNAGQLIKRALNMTASVTERMGVY